MRGVITVPQKVVTGAFTLLFSFPLDIVLTSDDISVETLEGDDLGDKKDTFGGSGKHYHLLCYIPDARAGKSLFRVSKEGVDVKPVIVDYDTRRTVAPVWGKPILRGTQVEIRVTFPIAIERLKKRNFRLSPSASFQLYGTGDTYSIVIANSNPRSVTVFGVVSKPSGIRVEIEQAIAEI